MSDDSEEKTLAPSDHKLRKAREKGQVASSQDFVSAAVTVAAILYLLFAWPSMVSSLDAMVTLSTDAAARPNVDTLLLPFYGILVSLGMTVLPLGILVLLVAIGANIIHKRGIPFSLHPVIPDFSRINPGQIFKKIFSRRNATEFGISLFRIIFWFVLAGIIIWLAMPDLLASTTCDTGCSLNVVIRIMVIIIAAVVILLLMAGLADLPVQNAIFRHEQKMGHNEFKRELKETMGNMEFKAHRKGEYQTMLTTQSTGNATSMIIASYSCAISIFYHPKDCPVPRVVARHSGATVADVLKRAIKAGIPVADDSFLANDIFQTVAPGSGIRERHFGKVALLMVNKGVL
ncbi:MAG: EscU/YscU/HrcU family type III secretion system export apparatus switch protein [Nitratireductor sp.]